QEHANSKHYVAWMGEHRMQIQWLPDDLQEGPGEAMSASLAVHTGRDILVTLDMDAVRSGDAPGTSAATPTGLSGNDLVQMARVAGENRDVKSLDIVEVSPPLDRDGQTSRLA